MHASLSRIVSEFNSEFCLASVLRVHDIHVCVFFIYLQSSSIKLKQKILYMNIL